MVAKIKRGTDKKAEWGTFIRERSERTRAKSFVLKEGRFRLDIRKKFFTQRAVMPWHSCPEKLWCPIPGGTPGQVGWGSGQPELGAQPCPWLGGWTR